MILSSAGVFMAMAAAATASIHVSTPVSYINYTTVTGYFLQDVASTNASAFNYVRSSDLGPLYCIDPPGRLPPTLA